MRSLLLCVLLAGCSDSPSGMLTLTPDATTVVVGQYTFVQAYLNDGVTTNPPSVAASWSVTPSGLVTLTASGNAQKVTGVAVGNVVVTASADNQTAQVGFTVVAGP